MSFRWNEIKENKLAIWDFGLQEEKEHIITKSDKEILQAPAGMKFEDMMQTMRRALLELIEIEEHRKRWKK